MLRIEHMANSHFRKVGDVALSLYEVAHQLDLSKRLKDESMLVLASHFNGDDVFVALMGGRAPHQQLLRSLRELAKEEQSPRVGTLCTSKGVDLYV